MTELILTNRLYKYIKSSAIVNLIQASVELVTNSDDAYRGSTLPPPYNIDIFINYKERTLQIYDQAIGLDAACMKKCFGQVGNYTSQMLNRGYFSRGAKDITAIGNASFVAIKDGKISEVSLSANDIFTVIRSDEPVHADDRAIYGIKKNGLWNQIDVKPSISFPDIEEMKNLGKYYSLRDIFSNKDNIINLTIIDPSGDLVYSERIVYEPLPVKETLIDEEFIVEGYPGVKAKFQLYLLHDKTDVSDHGSYMEHGIMISSGNAIHEVSTLYNDVRNHPYMKYIVGRISCDNINQLMYDFETNPDDVTNPHPIIDHSRISGLDRSHPFTKALFRIPHKQIKYVLQDLYENEIIDTHFSSEISSLFQDIEIFGKEFFKEMVKFIYPFKAVDSKKIEGFLVKRSVNVVTNDDVDSKFDFSNPSAFSKTKNDGKFVATEPSFNIIFTDKDYLEFSYSIYRLDNKIVLEININDFYVSKFIRRNDSGEIVFKNKNAAQVMLVDIITEAMARESIREKFNLDDGKSKNVSSDDIFCELEKIRAILLPKVFDIIISNDLYGVTIQ